MTYQQFTDKYQYDIDKDHLGDGGFGNVYRALDDTTDQYVAIKISAVKPGQENISLQHEVELAKDLPKHKNVAIYDTCYRYKTQQGTFDFGILQYYSEGNLSQLIKKNVLSFEQKERIAYGIMDGLAHLHDNNIIHRDLKSSNILIAKRESGDYIPKIADFGLSKMVNDGGKSQFSNSLNAGSLSYMAPEQLSNESHFRKNVDIWSLGVVLFELFTGQQPFKGTIVSSKVNPNYQNTGSELNRIELIKQINQGVLPDILNTIPIKWQEIIRKCIVVDPEKRAKSVSELHSNISPSNNKKSEKTFEETSFEPTTPNEILTTKPENKNKLKKSLTIVVAILAISFGIYNLIDGYKGYREASDLLENIDKEKNKKYETATFEITYPSYMSLDTSGKHGSEFFLYFPKINNIRPNINLSIQDLSNLNYNLESFTKLSIKQIETEIEDGKLISIEKLKDNDGAVYQQLVYSGMVNGDSLKITQNYWVVDNKAYLLTYTNELSSDADHDKIVEDIFRTFRLKNTETLAKQQIQDEGKKQDKIKDIIAYDDTDKANKDEQNMFEQAVIDNTFSSCQRYKDNYPNGRYEKEANYRIMKILKTEEQKKKEQTSTAKPFIKMISIPGRNFKLSETEVTIGQYLAFCKATNNHWPVWLEKGNDFNIYTGNHTWYKREGMSEKNSNLPVTGVSSMDVEAFCKWMGGRLPTEAEWEYAAKGGEDYEYAGSNNMDEVGWHKGNSKDKIKSVKQKQANGYGLYDMSGNVSELTSTKEGGFRVYRGGCWFYSNNSCRVLFRETNEHCPDGIRSGGGFRLAISQ